MRALTRVLLPEAPAGQSFKVHCSVWLRRCPCHCSSWKVVMADKAEAIQFGDSLPLAEPANLAARLECSFRSNLKKNAIVGADTRSEEHTSELQSLMRISYAAFCLKKKKK